MTFKLELVKPVEGLERIDSDSGRIYKRGDKTYRSVTSVLSKLGADRLESWKASVGHDKAAAIAKQAANRGTIVHKLCEDYLMGKQTNQPIMPIYLDDFKKAKQVIDRHVRVVKGVELQLYSDELRAAGTTDVFCEWEVSNIRDVKKLICPAIIDFKTKKSTVNPQVLKMHFIQETAYAIMINELYNVFVPKLVIIALEQNSPLPSVYEARTVDYLDKTKQIFKSIDM